MGKWARRSASLSAFRDIRLNMLFLLCTDGEGGRSGGASMTPVSFAWNMDILGCCSWTLEMMSLWEACASFGFRTLVNLDHISWRRGAGGESMAVSLRAAKEAGDGR